MPKLLIAIGPSKGLPPRFGKKRPDEDEIERQAEAYGKSRPRGQYEDPAMSGGNESPAYEQEAHGLGAGKKFPAENVHYHVAADECQGCHHWEAQTSSCKVVAMATDPGGWCSLFPGEYDEHELTEQPGVEEEEPGVEGSEGMAA
jgi:hypothetical protein